MKKYLSYLLIISCLFIITGCSCSKKIEDNVINQRIFSNDNEGVHVTEKNKDIEYKINSLTIDNGKYSTIIINIINNTDKEYIVEPFLIDFFDKNENKIFTIRVDDPKKVESNQGVYIDEAVEFDLTDAYSVKYTFN